MTQWGLRIPSIIGKILKECRRNSYPTRRLAATRSTGSSTTSATSSTGIHYPARETGCWLGTPTVSYTHLRAHETEADL
eukprot:2647598-Rhodomonas_salina.1